MSKNDKKKKKSSGSILVGIVLVFLMISSIALAVVGRARNGAVLTTDAKKGYSAYQASDSSTEQILNSIKSLDGDTSGRIPENTSVSGVCGNQCYASDNSALNSLDKVAEIFSIKKSGEAQSATRAVLAPVLDRVKNPVSVFAISNDFPNLCDAKLVLTYGSGTDWTNISNLEVRKSLTGSSLSSDSWKPLERNNTLIANGDILKIIKNSEFEYGKNYSFSLKAKNKNPLSLDSLYYSVPVTFSTPAQNCSGGQRIGCYGAPLTGSTKSSSSFACCGGTECFECSAGWDVTGNCCTERCPVHTCPHCACGGGGETGTCATVNCQPFNDTRSCAACAPCP